MNITEFLAPLARAEKHWTLEDVEREFKIWGYDAPHLLVKRRSDNKKGTMEFVDLPRFSGTADIRLYFNFVEQS